MTRRNWVVHAFVLLALVACSGLVYAYEVTQHTGFGDLRGLLTYLWAGCVFVYAVISSIAVAALGSRVRTGVLHVALISAVVILIAVFVGIPELLRRRNFGPRADLRTAFVLKGWRLEERQGSVDVVAELHTDLDADVTLSVFRGYADGKVVLLLAHDSLEPPREKVRATKGRDFVLRQRVLRMGEGTPTKFELFFALTDGEWRNEAWFLPDEKDHTRSDSGPHVLVRPTPEPSP